VGITSFNAKILLALMLGLDFIKQTRFRRGQHWRSLQDSLPTGETEPNRTKHDQRAAAKQTYEMAAESILNYSFFNSMAIHKRGIPTTANPANTARQSAIWDSRSANRSVLLLAKAARTGSHCLAHQHR
jgi:hypothetical protein